MVPKSKRAQEPALKAARSNGKKQNGRAALKVVVPGPKQYPNSLSIMLLSLSDAPQKEEAVDNAAQVTEKPHKASYFLPGCLEGKPVQLLAETGCTTNLSSERVFYTFRMSKTSALWT